MSTLLMKISPILIKFDDEKMIRWYAICILVGALLAYLTSSYCFKKGGFSQDIPDTIICIAFPLGILGARAWWCICENGNLQGMISEFAEGGLAVQGGVLLGVISGVLVMLLKFKECKLMFAVDCVVPNILIAQSVARWGNFFNQEVYGACVDYDKLNFLPDFIHEQMRGDIDPITHANVGEFKADYSYINCYTNQAAQPLFLYEGIINLIGWILISIILRKFWKKGRKDGDLGCLYFVWYGIVRMLMEPLRNSEFIMNSWGTSTLSSSVITSIIFICIGIIGLILLRIIPLLIRKKQHD